MIHSSHKPLRHAYSVPVQGCTMTKASSCPHVASALPSIRTKPAKVVGPPHPQVTPKTEPSAITWKPNQVQPSLRATVLLGALLTPSPNQEESYRESFKQTRPSHRVIVARLSNVFIILSTLLMAATDFLKLHCVSLEDIFHN